MRLLSLVDNLEGIASRIDALVSYNLVPRDIDVTLDFCLQLAVIPQNVQMWTFDDQVSAFPRIIVLSFLPHPSIVICLANLFNDALSSGKWSGRMNNGPWNS